MSFQVEISLLGGAVISGGTLQASVNYATESLNWEKISNLDMHCH